MCHAKLDAVSGKLALGISDFSRIRREGCLYVDKTELIYELACTDLSYLYIRPRGFGKSTLLSTFKELFSHGVEPYEGQLSPFVGLAVEKLWRQSEGNAGPYYVIKLDFGKLYQEGRPIAEAEKRLCQCLCSQAAEFGLSLRPEESRSSFDLIRAILRRLPDGSAVLLIDDYDACINGCDLRDEQEVTAAYRMLRGILSCTKTQDVKLLFTFVTGTTLCREPSIFAAADALYDISQSPRWSALCGFTGEELQSCFGDYLQQAEGMVELLEAWCGGYTFDHAACTHLLKPSSVLHFLQELEKGLQGCLAKTAVQTGDAKHTVHAERAPQGPLASRVKELLQGPNCGQLLDKLLSGDVEVSRQKFSWGCSLQQADVRALLFALGLLSIKAPVAATVRLGIPNAQVRQVLAAWRAGLNAE